MDERILTIMRNVFEDEAIDTTCSRESCEKWDSLHQLNLICELEEEFDVEFEPEEIAEMTTFAKVKEMLVSKC